MLIKPAKRFSGPFNLRQRYQEKSGVWTSTRGPWVGEDGRGADPLLVMSTGCATAPA